MAKGKRRIAIGGRKGGEGGFDRDPGRRVRVAPVTRRAGRVHGCTNGPADEEYALARAKLLQPQAAKTLRRTRGAAAQKAMKLKVRFPSI
jgi:hypothetical protein